MHGSSSSSESDSDISLGAGTEGNGDIDGSSFFSESDGATEMALIFESFKKTTKPGPGSSSLTTDHPQYQWMERPRNSVVKIPRFCNSRKYPEARTTKVLQRPRSSGGLGDHPTAAWPCVKIFVQISVEPVRSYHVLLIRFTIPIPYELAPYLLKELFHKDKRGARNPTTPPHGETPEMRPKVAVYTFEECRSSQQQRSASRPRPKQENFDRDGVGQ